MKVTVELTEGNKETVEVNLSEEFTIMGAESNLMSKDLHRRMIDLASRAAQKAMCFLYQKIAATGTVVQFDHDNTRQVIPLNDLDTLPEEQKIKALKSIQDSIVKWDKNKKKKFISIEGKEQENVN